MLFEVFSVDSMGPFLVPYRDRPSFLLVCLEHLTYLPKVIATKNATVPTKISFIENKVCHMSVVRRLVVSNNAGCLTARSMVDFMKNSGVQCNPVAFYVLICNGKPELMVGNIKKVTGILVLDNPKDRQKHYKKASRLSM